MDKPDIVVPFAVTGIIFIVIYVLFLHAQGIILLILVLLGLVLLLYKTICIIKKLAPNSKIEKFIVKILDTLKNFLLEFIKNA